MSPGKIEVKQGKCVEFIYLPKGEAEFRVRFAFKPSSKIFCTDHTKAVLLLWMVFVSYASCWCVLCLFLVASWSSAEKGRTYWQ